MASESEDFVYFLGKGEEIPKTPMVSSMKAPLLNELLTESEGEASVSPEADSPSAAINEETGEINWDCPCLKSALEPPCGHTFKAAFACFVASKTEPKGIDCHELFKAMQDCFQAHPEKYGSILDDAEDDDADDELMNVEINGEKINEKEESI